MSCCASVAAVGSPTFTLEHETEYGIGERVSPSIERVTANNPSKFTFRGTGTYLIGDPQRVVLIDPGPLDDKHHRALLAAIGPRSVIGILITHTHGDHSPLAARFDAPTFGFGPHPPGARSEGEAADDATERDSHSDEDFVPDHAVSHAEVIDLNGIRFECLHTPGHISNHLCFVYPAESAMFTGDHVMGWSTTIIPPPDGNMNDYLASLEMLIGRPEEVYYPTHGAPIHSPQLFVRDLIAHRREREAQIADLLSRGPAMITELVAVLYADVAEELHKPAARSVEAHLIAMSERGDVKRTDIEDKGSLYTWIRK
jgi:glyoxylase-like metal-dependent hydrolase (beta-lactamase superfamily II)